MRAWLTVLALVAVALAGCFGGGDETDGSTSDDEPKTLQELESRAQDFEVETAPDKGVLRGVVVDAAIRPIPDAEVTVRSLSGSSDGGAVKPLTGVTNAEGLFGFGNLEPGTYSILVKRIGYVDAQANADVKAGDAKPPIVKVILEADPAGTPFVEVLKYDGFIECSTVTIALRLAVCSLPSLATDIICADAGICPGNLTNDQFLARHAIDPNNVAYLQSEMVWSSTQALGARMNAVPGHWNPETGDWDDVDSIDDVSPLIMQFNETTVGPMQEAGGFQVRVFSSYLEETDVDGDGILWGVGLVFQQEFTIITHVFHGFQPDDGWTFIEDGSPQVPA